MRRSVSTGVVLGLSLVVAAPSATFAVGAQADTETSGVIEDCTRNIEDGWSVARAWDEALLAAIRRALPAPTLHARNLFHTSVGMWDAWAAYDPTADGYLVDEKHTATDVEAARETAISFAAYRILSHRYATANGAEESLAQFDATMANLCLDPAFADAEGASPAALGNRIAAAIIEFGLADGSNEANGYVAPDYAPVNEPMIVKEPGTVMADPDRWQPLALDSQVAQNGVPIPDKVQTHLGPHWGNVASFGLPVTDNGVPIDPGAPPRLADPATVEAFQQAAVDVIRMSSLLDANDDTMIDASPAVMGDNPLGTNDGSGHSVNPVTGEPYAPNPVRRSDYLRALVEYWADGPQSETPPGHWNVVANQVADSEGFEFRLGGTGPVLDRLQWDVKTYFALNGAVHDAAVAAWGVKGWYDSARPISMIRFLAGNGQSTNRRLPSYSPQGLPLERGLIEVITRRSSAPGGRHEALREFVGQIAIRSWLGNPEDPETQASGAGWILGTTWVAYQKPTFVTPAFAGYVSGHSTFSRAAAEVMTRLTGSAFFPGGLFQWSKPAGSLEVEAGPVQDVVLQAATYYDAADQAGISRLYGGIHIVADDVSGRIVGSECGRTAWALAQTYFEGTARV